mmetsp:Transcript_43374/g.125391  ORF Transcript_43374/g.125391 Transcript_43374/m.125391 type:complete len:159 (-) Transcript_43374:38-514(-)
MRAMSVRIVRPRIYKGITSIKIVRHKIFMCRQNSSIHDTDRSAFSLRTILLPKFWCFDQIHSVGSQLSFSKLSNEFARRPFPFRRPSRRIILDGLNSNQRVYKRKLGIVAQTNRKEHGPWKFCDDLNASFFQLLSAIFFRNSRSTLNDLLYLRLSTFL